LVEMPGWRDYFERLVSSHVGSLPIDYSEEAVSRCVGDMLAAGIDIVPIPQLRDFVDMFMEPLVKAGVVGRGAHRYVVSEEEVTSIHRVEPVIPEYELFFSREAPKVGLVRVSVTGPFTLASRLYLEGEGEPRPALSDPEIVLGELARYVRNAVRRYSGGGRGLVVVDEPVLGNVVGARVVLYGYRGDDIADALSGVLKPVPSRMARGVHVCGRLNVNLASILSEVDTLDLLNHEFRDTPANMEIPWKTLLERGDKFLSPGLFSSRRLQVEDVGEMLATARRVIGLAGLERVNVFTGDCGLRGLRGSPGAYEAAVAKLRNLARCTRRLNEEFKLAV